MPDRMRNSLLPLGLLLVVSVTVLLLIPWSAGPGREGPRFEAGVFAYPKQTWLRVHPATLRHATTLAGAPAAPQTAGWHVVVVAGTDRSPFTLATMYALAERITTAGGIALLAPVPAPPTPLGEPPLALPAQRLLRVTTVAAAAPAERTAPASASVRIDASALRLPEDHPGARLQPGGGMDPASIAIEHRSEPADAPWPERWSGIGHAIAGAALDRLVTAAAFAASPHADWSTPVPPPVVHEVARWDGCFQFPFVRGWTGRVDGVTTLQRGETVPVFQPLERLLRSGWTEQRSTDPAVRLWSKDIAGEPAAWFSARADAHGAALAWWQERTDAAAVVSRWLDQARRGDVSVRAWLAAHRATPGIPEDLRAEIATLVAAPAIEAPATAPSVR